MGLENAEAPSSFPWTSVHQGVASVQSEEDESGFLESLQDSRGRWTLLGWLPIGGDLESTSMHLGLRICTPVFILICIPPVMEPRASRRKLTQVLLQEAEICWRSGLSRWSMFCFLVWSEAKVFWWLFFRRSSLGGAVPLLDHEVVVATGSHFVAKRRGRSAQETEGRPRKKGSWRLS